MEYTGEKADGAYSGTLKPLFCINRENPKEVLRWLCQALDIAKKDSNERVKQIYTNIATYKGIHWKEQETKAERRTSGSATSGTSADASQSTPLITVNHMYDMTENKVARMSRFKPVIQVSPANGTEYSDKLAARTHKELLDFIVYENSLHQKFIEFSRYNYIGGEAYLWIKWCKDKGDLDENYKMLAEKGPIALLGPDGNEVKIEGQVVYIEKEVFKGDVEFETLMADKVFLEPLQEFEKCSWLFREFEEDVDVLKAEYPGKKVSEDPGDQTYSMTELEVDRREALQSLNRTKYYELWHKKTKFLPKGFYAKFTASDVLEFGDHPYKHRKFPCVRLVDIKVPNCRDGMSNYINGKPLNSIINIMKSMKLRNHILGSHLHWICPDGMVKTENLGNDATKVSYKGSNPPQLVTFPVIPRDMHESEQDAKTDLQQIMGVFGVSRGEPPPGVKAGVAMNFLEEQENERMNAEVVQFSEAIVDCFKMTLELVRQFYREDDNRLVKIVGKDSEWEIKQLKVKDLTTPVDIRLQNSSALPQSRAGRTQAILDIDQQRPGMFTNEQFIEALDLGLPVDSAADVTKALRAAQYETERILNGEQTGEPAEWEKHLAHWQVHFNALQSPQFKNGTPPEIKQGLIDHLMAHEYFMDKRRMKDPGFDAALKALIYWPAVYVVAPPPPAQLPINQFMPLDPSGMAPVGMPPPEALAQMAGAMEMPEMPGPVDGGSPMMAPPAPGQTLQ